MRIAIDNRAVVHSGIGNYSAILLSMLPKVEKEVETVPYEDGLAFNRQGFWNKYVNGLRRLIRDQFMFRWVDKNNIDIFHNPRNTGVPVFKPFKIVVTIHDVIPHVFPQYYLNSWIERLYYEMMIRLSIYRSDKIITISEFSKQELIKYYNVPEEKIIVTPLACSDKCRVLVPEVVFSVTKKYDIKRPYILTIGGSEYRKNVKTVLEAYDDALASKYDLIIIGGSWRGLDLAAEYRGKPGIKFLKGIPDEDLIALYNGAAVFIYASFYEGFGLPLLEAMNCGTPVIAAEASCLPEVADKAALYFKPLDVNDLQEKIRKVLQDEKLLQSYRQTAARRAGDFTYEKYLEQFLKLAEE